jgi:hypothetical protein
MQSKRPMKLKKNATNSSMNNVENTSESTFFDQFKLNEDLVKSSVKESLTPTFYKPNKKEASLLDPSTSIDLAVIFKKLTDDNGNFAGEEVYVVMDKIQHHLINDIRIVRCHAGRTEHGKDFILIQKMPGIDGYTNSWTETQAIAVDVIKQPGNWARVWADSIEKQYKFQEVKLNKAPQTFRELGPDLKAAIGSNIIDSLDHPLLVELGITVPKSHTSTVDEVFANLDDDDEPFHGDIADELVA